jgi:hypothetical protein
VLTAGVDLAADPAGTAVAAVSWSAADRPGAVERVRGPDRAYGAMRCAALQTRLARAGRSVDRSGGGAVVEVYPAASLKVWGLPWRGYKTTENQAVLGTVVDHLRQAVPWLDLGGHEELCRRSDHALDAVVAALTAGSGLSSRGAGAAGRPDRGLDRHSHRHAGRPARIGNPTGRITIPTAPTTDLPGKVGALRYLLPGGEARTPPVPTGRSAIPPRW